MTLELTLELSSDGVALFAYVGAEPHLQGLSGCCFDASQPQGMPLLPGTALCLLPLFPRAAE